MKKRKTCLFNLIILFLMLSITPLLYSQKDEDTKNLVLIGIHDDKALISKNHMRIIDDVIYSSIESMKSFYIHKLQYGTIAKINGIEKLINFINVHKNKKEILDIDNEVVRNVSSETLKLMLNAYLIVIPEMVYNENFTSSKEEIKIENNNGNVINDSKDKPANNSTKTMYKHKINISIDIILRFYSTDIETDCKPITSILNGEASILNQNKDLTDDIKNELRNKASSNITVGLFSNISTKINENDCFTFNSVVLNVEANNVTIGVGKNIGVKTGDEFHVIPINDDLDNNETETGGYIRIHEVNEHTSKAKLLWGYAVKNDIVKEQEKSGMGIELRTSFVYWKRNLDFLLWIDPATDQINDRWAEITTLSFSKELAYQFRFSFDFSVMVPSFKMQTTYYPSFIEFSLAHVFYLANRISFDVALSAGVCVFYGSRKVYSNQDINQKANRNTIKSNTYGGQIAMNLYYQLNEKFKLFIGSSLRYYLATYVSDDELMENDPNKKIKIEMTPITGLQAGIVLRF